MDRFGFLENELNLERQKGTQPTTFAGLYRGYYTIFEVNEAGGDAANQFVVKVGATFDSEERWFLDLRNEVGSEHNAFLEKHRHVIMALGKLPQKNKEAKEFIYRLFDKLINTLIKHDIPTGDFVNGQQTENVEVYLVNNHYNYLSEQSYEELSERIGDNAEQNQDQETSIRSGMSGAILGALLGALIWAIFVYFGLQSWVAALVAAHLAFMFYRKRSGKTNTFGVIIVSLSVIIALIVANLGLGALGINLISSNLLLSIGVVIAYALIFAYGVYTAAKNNQTIKKV